MATTPSPIGKNDSFVLTVPKALQSEAYTRHRALLATKVTLPGFRKGKAPAHLVESHIGSESIVQKVLEEVLPKLYSEAISEKKLAPVVEPHFSITNAPLDGDWEIQVTIAQAPVVDVSSWEKIVSKSKKDFVQSKKDETPEQFEERTLSHIWGALLKDINPQIPPLLLEHETRHQIEEFASRLASHKLDLDTYLQSSHMTIQELQKEYTARSLAVLQAEFITLALIKLLNPLVSEKEIDDLLGDEGKKLPKEYLERAKHDARHMLERKSVQTSLQKAFQSK